MAETVSTRGRVGRRRKNTTEEFKEKMEALSLHFNAVVFPPLRHRLDIRAHESLLKRLGLWEFANLDFGETVREDMVKELVLCYRYSPGNYGGYSRVNGAVVRLNRTALGKALRLPPPVKKGEKGRHFWVTKEEGSFLEELIWRFMVLRDDGDSVMSESYVVEFVKVLGELRFEGADWAGLVWFMVSRELSQGTDLGKCYYASHLQLVLKHQRPELFENSGKERAGNREVLDLDAVGDADEKERLRKLQFGNDDQLVEDGNDLEVVCFDSLRKEKGSLNPDSHSSDCDVSVTEPASSQSNPVGIAGLKRAHRDGYLGMESMRHSQNAYVEERKNEGVMDSEGLMSVSFQKENDVNERCEKEDSIAEVKETGAASEANGFNLLGFQEGVMEDQENEASFSYLLKEDVNMAKIDACFEKTDEESQTAFKHLEEPMDLDFCAEKIKVWAARFADAARRKVEEKQIYNLMLQKKFKHQNQMIQQYKLMLHKERQQKQHHELMLELERQQKQISDYKYNRELHMMEKVLEDYREALKQTRTAFAMYRERVQLPEEPLYTPHPDGGGDVILVSEWKKLEKEREEMAIIAMLEEFEGAWVGKMEEQLCIYDMYCGKLEDLEDEVRKIRGS